MSAPSFNAFQQVFALSMFSNLASGYLALTPYKGSAKDPFETQLSENIQNSLNNATVQAAIGSSWNVAWGPAVWRNDDKSLVADNAAFVAYNPSMTYEDGSQHPTYVVAIAATNFISSFDWLTEDFSVSNIIDFNSYNPLSKPFPPGKSYAFVTPVISEGTAIGVSAVLQLTPWGGESLLTYLKNLQPAANARIIFTGHSLAGALSPTIALYLKNQSILSKFQTALVYPTAGATPGNPGFAANYQAAFPQVPAAAPAPWQCWNALIHNQYDVVPHAWYLGTLSEIYGLYGNSIKDNPLPAGIAAALVDAVVRSTASTVLYTPLNGQVIAPSTVPTDPNPTGYEDFFNNVLTQHTTVYADTILQGQIPKFDYPAIVGLVKVDALAEAAKKIIAWIESKFAALKSVV